MKTELLWLPEIREVKISEVKKQLADPEVQKVSDFDKTLFDTDHFHEAVNPEIFADLKIGPENLAPEVIDSLRGRTDMECFRLLAPQAEDREIMEAVLKRERRLCEELDKESQLEKYLMPGMDEFVRYMRRTGQKAGIASLNFDSFIKKFIKKCELDGKSIGDVFPPEGIIGISSLDTFCGENNIPPLCKPSTFHVYLSAMSISGGKRSSEILYLGDSDTDAESVKKKPGITGVVMNPKEHEEMQKKYKDCENIIFLSSVKDILPGN